ncbi:YEATS family protein [Cooperia oncophora]
MEIPKIEEYRARGQRFVKPIVYGNVAKVLDCPDDAGNTHEWTLFICPYYTEDLSLILSKVTIKLPQSFTAYKRVLEKPPYEITERGKEELRCRIRLHFVDELEKPLTFYYRLNLTEPLVKLDDGSLCVVDERYDEIVSSNDSALILHLLTHNRSLQYTKFSNTCEIYLICTFIW